MPDAKKRYRRKQDGYIVGPLTEDEANTMAGFDEGEFEPVEEYQPAEFKPADPAETKPTRTRTRTRRTAPVPKGETAPTPPAGDPAPTETS